MEKKLYLVGLNYKTASVEVRERFACDTVLCLALIHHLVFVAGMTLEQIFEVLAKLTKKTLILEFVDLEDSHIQKGINNPNIFNSIQTHKNIIHTLQNYAYKYYNLEHFLTLSKKYFHSVEVINSHPATRSLLILKK